MIGAGRGAWVLATDGPYGDGRIDNLVLDPAVHRTMGIVVLVAMVGATVHLARLAVARKRLDRTAKVLLAVAQVTLMVQALFGIKLLDQGQGANQLYIHYIGGLMPLGFYLAAGWFGRSDSPARTRWLAALTTAGLAAATMSFFIGRAYVNRSL